MILEFLIFDLFLDDQVVLFDSKHESFHHLRSIVAKQIFINLVFSIPTSLHLLPLSNAKVVQNIISDAILASINASHIMCVSNVQVYLCWELAQQEGNSVNESPFCRIMQCRFAFHALSVDIVDVLIIVLA